RRMAMVDMSLQELLKAAGLGVSDGHAEVRVRGLELDSRRVQPGYVFVALSGFTTHGMAFATAACAQGAVAIIADETPAAASWKATASAAQIPVIWVKNLRQHMGNLCNAIFDHPTRDMCLI